MKMLDKIKNKILPRWECPECQTMNHGRSKTCKECGRNKAAFSEMDEYLKTREGAMAAMKGLMELQPSPSQVNTVAIPYYSPLSLSANPFVTGPYTMTDAGLFEGTVFEPRTSCNNCGACCRSCVPTPNEVQVIADHLHLTIGDTVNMYFRLGVTTDGLYFLKTRSKELSPSVVVCSFLNYGQVPYCQCSIYTVRPESCREYKCWPMKVVDGQIPERSDSVESWRGFNFLSSYAIDTTTAPVDKV